MNNDYLRYPYAMVEENEPERIAPSTLRESNESEEESKRGAVNAKILLVDDYFYDLTSINSLLHQNSFAIDTTIDGNLAFEMVKNSFKQNQTT